MNTNPARSASRGNLVPDLSVTARTVAEVLGEWKGISVDALLDTE